MLFVMGFHYFIVTVFPQNRMTAVPSWAILIFIVWGGKERERLSCRREKAEETNMKLNIMFCQRHWNGFSLHEKGWVSSLGFTKNAHSLCTTERWVLSRPVVPYVPASVNHGALVCCGPPSIQLQKDVLMAWCCCYITTNGCQIVLISGKYGPREDWEGGIQILQKWQVHNALLTCRLLGPAIFQTTSRAPMEHLWSTDHGLGSPALGWS